MLTLNLMVAAAGICLFATPLLVAIAFLPIQLLLDEPAEMRTYVGVGVLVYLACLVAIAVYAARGKFKIPTQPHVVYWIGQVVLLIANAVALPLLFQVPMVRTWSGFTAPASSEGGVAYVLLGVAYIAVIMLWLVGFLLVRVVWNEGKAGGYGARPYRSPSDG